MGELGEGEETDTYLIKGNRRGTRRYPLLTDTFRVKTETFM